MHQFSKHCNGWQEVHFRGKTRTQLLEKDFKIDANGARAFIGHFLFGVETVKRFVNVHLHCNVSNLKNISNTGWHKKTVITRNGINSKISFRLTQNFSYIRSSLCSKHLQNFKSVLQKLFFSLALKKCGPNDLPGAGGMFGSGGQSSRWPSRIPPLGSLLLLPSGQG